ncbi:hypothetical protein [Kiloniella antarctica]|uniref:Uracil-DNA glycosylase-like domain-containing protein n=1 Tax=Kiloniella antarctica TaxID=1550907 RepID=A0ABW5BM24_9PROT
MASEDVDYFQNEHHDNYFDNDFDKINELTYLPWVGSKYKGLYNKQKILVIAESVYNWDENSQHAWASVNGRNFSRHVVHKHGLYHTVSGGVENAPTYRNLERSLSGQRNLSPEARVEFWSSIAFQQHVQRPMRNKKERPSPEDYEKGSRVLKDIISITKPDLCVYMGTDWRKLSAIMDVFGIQEIKQYSKINGAIPKKLTLELQGSTIPLIMIKHPNRFFSWDKWFNEVIKDEIK